MPFPHLTVTNLKNLAVRVLPNGQLCLSQEFWALIRHSSRRRPQVDQVSPSSCVRWLKMVTNDRSRIEFNSISLWACLSSCCWPLLKSSTILHRLPSWSLLIVLNSGMRLQVRYTMVERRRRVSGNLKPTKGMLLTGYIHATSTGWSVLWCLAPVPATSHCVVNSLFVASRIINATL